MEFRSVVVQLVLVLILLQAVLMAHIVSLLVDLFSGFTDDILDIRRTNNARCLL